MKPDEATGQLPYDPDREALAMSLLDHLDIVTHQREVFVRIALDGSTVEELAKELSLPEEAIVSLYSAGNAIFEAALARRRETLAQDASKASLLPFLTRSMIIAILETPEPADEAANERLWEKIVARIGDQVAPEANLSQSLPDHHRTVVPPSSHRAPRRLH